MQSHRKSSKSNATSYLNSFKSSKFIKPAPSNEHPFIKSSIAEDDKVTVRESVTSALASALASIKERSS